MTFFFVIMNSFLNLLCCQLSGIPPAHVPRCVPTHTIPRSLGTRQSLRADSTLLHAQVLKPSKWPFPSEPLASPPWSSLSQDKLHGLLLHVTHASAQTSLLGEAFSGLLSRQDLLPLVTASPGSTAFSLPAITFYVFICATASLSPL